MKRRSLTAAILLAGMAAGAAAQEDKVAELEKQLRSTQDFFAAELLALRKDTEKKPESAPGYKIGGYVNVRYDYTQSGVRKTSGKAVDAQSGFSVERARLKVEGNLDKTKDYRLQLEFRQKSQFQLLDGWVGLMIADPAIKVQAGQAQPKTQGDGDANARQFLDLSNSSDTFKPECRDRGLWAGGLLLDKALLYQFQFVNGNGVTDSTHNDRMFRYGLVLKYEPLGKMSVYQNDLEREALRIGFGASAHRSRETDALKGYQKKEWYISSVYAKWRGLYAKLLGARQNIVGHKGGAANDQWYLSAQTGYAMPVWKDQLLEPAFRVEKVNKNTELPGQAEVWATAGANYYIKGNDCKLSLNYVMKHESGLNRLRNNVLELGLGVTF